VLSVAAVAPTPVVPVESSELLQAPRKRPAAKERNEAERNLVLSVIGITVAVGIAG
jgi:hypothetical protein